MYSNEALHRDDGLQEAWQYVMCSEEHLHRTDGLRKAWRGGPTDYMYLFSNEAGREKGGLQDAPVARGTRAAMSFAWEAILKHIVASAPPILGRWRVQQMTPTSSSG